MKLIIIIFYLLDEFKSKFLKLRDSNIINNSFTYVGGNNIRKILLKILSKMQFPPILQVYILYLSLYCTKGKIILLNQEMHKKRRSVMMIFELVLIEFTLWYYIGPRYSIYRPFSQTHTHGSLNFSLENQIV